MLAAKYRLLLQSTAAFTLKYAQATKIKRDKVWGVSSTWVIYCKYWMPFLLMQNENTKRLVDRTDDDFRNEVTQGEFQFQQLRQDKTTTHTPHDGDAQTSPNIFIRLTEAFPSVPLTERRQSPRSARNSQNRLSLRRLRLREKETQSRFPSNAKLCKNLVMLWVRHNNGQATEGEVRSSVFHLFNNTRTMKCSVEGVLGKVRGWTHRVDDLKLQPMRRQEGPSATAEEQKHSFNSRHQ